MPTDVGLANRAWESLLTAHAVLLRGFAAESVWRDHGLAMREYDVLYTLAKCESRTGAPGPGAARFGELQQRVLLSQPALSRMVDRLAARGLVERVGDDEDRRAVRVRLTPEGRELQRTVGRAHARSVAREVGAALDAEELLELERLTAKLVRHGREDPAEQARPGDDEARSLSDAQPARNDEEEN